MTGVSLFLLTIAGIFLIGIIGELVFEKTGVPDVIWLIIVGVVLGPITGLVDRAQLQAVAPYFGALTLVIVLFDGGSGLRLKELSPALGRGTLLAILGFVTSTAVLAAASVLAVHLRVLPESWTWNHGIILGAILGGSSSVVIMPALRMSRLSPRISNVLNLESALTDVLCVVVTLAAIRVATGGAMDIKTIGITLGRAFGIGLGIGLAVGLLALLALRFLKKSEHAYPIILGTLLVVYVVIDRLGGSAALGILVIAVLVGNAPTLANVVGLSRQSRLSRGVENAHDQITFIIKSFFFTFIGAMLGQPWGMVALGALLGVILLLARVPVVAGATLGTGLPLSARGIVAVSMPRGMAAGVLAIFPSQAGIPGMDQLPVIVFAAVIVSIVMFATGFPVFRHRLRSTDPGLFTDAAPAPTGRIGQPKPVPEPPIPETPAAPPGSPEDPPT